MALGGSVMEGAGDGKRTVRQKALVPIERLPGGLSVERKGPERRKSVPELGPRELDDSEWHWAAA